MGQNGEYLLTVGLDCYTKPRYKYKSEDGRVHSKHSHIALSTPIIDSIPDVNVRVMVVYHHILVNLSPFHRRITRF